MRVPVQIYVQNKIFQNQTEEERIEFYTTGEFFKKQHTFYLVYDEIQDDETVKTLIKISEKNDSHTFRRHSLKTALQAGTKNVCQL